MATTDAPLPDLPRRGGRRFAVALIAVLALWTGLVGGLAYLLYARTYWLRESDEANLREWLDESRVARKSLKEQVAELLEMMEAKGLSEADEPVVLKREEIVEQLKRLVDPTRIYQEHLPLFPVVYRLEIYFPGTSWKPLLWDSPVPRPRSQLRAVSQLDYPLLGRSEKRVALRCDYRLHAYNARQREAEESQKRLLLAIGLAMGAGLPAIGWVYYWIQREKGRELDRLRAEQRAEHAANQALGEKLARQEAERASEDLNRKLLEQSLEAAKQEGRAAIAERATLELKSQLFASIGIMAGSYAHNIKNLLVRPNDLLARCLDADGLAPKQHAMLGEVRETLGTVTERLQQILKTVRRDPTHSEKQRIDLNVIAKELLHTWEELARDKWKLTLTGEFVPGEVWIAADPSHLVQALENLLFNSRDATFEMRNHLRNVGRDLSDVNARRQAIVDAAAWRGQITLRTLPGGILEVSDNGIGMTDEVKQRCTETHFTTKRDNALFEGLSAGMGLGLSFVTMVLENHGAKLTIDTAPLRGATFRIQF